MTVMADSWGKNNYINTEDCSAEVLKAATLLAGNQMVDLLIVFRELIYNSKLSSQVSVGNLRKSSSTLRLNPLNTTHFYQIAAVSIPQVLDTTTKVFHT
jgi:hypothetical protein